MQTLTKTELSWIYDALNKSAMADLHAMQEVDENSPIYHFHELHKENCRSVMHKIRTALVEDSKRIAIQ